MSGLGSIRLLGALARKIHMTSPLRVDTLLDGCLIADTPEDLYEVDLLEDRHQQTES